MLSENWKDRGKHPTFSRANPAPPHKHALGARISVHVLASLVASARRSRDIQRLISRLRDIQRRAKINTWLFPQVLVRCAGRGVAHFVFLAEGIPLI